MNGFSTVDYVVLSESLLPSVLYFTNYEFNYLSDHSQIKVILKCKVNSNIESSCISKWPKTQNFKWSILSKEKLLDCMSKENVINDIINFETKSFAQDRSGINTASEELTNLLSHLTVQSCKVTKQKKKPTKKIKQKWSDQSVQDQKKSLNLILSKIRKNPYDNELKQKYFCQLKTFRKIVKQKKKAYMKSLYDKLSDTMNNNPQEQNEG